ncbi:UCKL1 protein, partial [Polypterus senegalus]
MKVVFVSEKSVVFGAGGDTSKLRVEEVDNSDKVGILLLMLKLVVDCVKAVVVVEFVTEAGEKEKMSDKEVKFVGGTFTVVKRVCEEFTEIIASLVVGRILVNGVEGKAVFGIAVVCIFVKDNETVLFITLVEVKFVEGKLRVGFTVFAKGVLVVILIIFVKAGPVELNIEELGVIGVREIVVGSKDRLMIATEFTKFFVIADTLFPELMFVPEPDAADAIVLSTAVNKLELVDVVRVKREVKLFGTVAVTVLSGNVIFATGSFENDDDNAVASIAVNMVFKDMKAAFVGEESVVFGEGADASELRADEEEYGDKKTASLVVGKIFAADAEGKAMFGIPIVWVLSKDNETVLFIKVVEEILDGDETLLLMVGAASDLSDDNNNNALVSAAVNMVFLDMNGAFVCNESVVCSKGVDDPLSTSELRLDDEGNPNERDIDILDIQSVKEKLRKVLKRMGKLKCTKQSCTASFTSIMGYMYHIKKCGKKASELENLMMNCKHCGKAYKSKAGLEYHMKSEHGPGNFEAGKYKCLLCKKEFISESGVKYHINSVHAQCITSLFQNILAALKLVERNNMAAPIKTHSLLHGIIKDKLCTFEWGILFSIKLSGILMAANDEKKQVLEEEAMGLPSNLDFGKTVKQKADLSNSSKVAQTKCSSEIEQGSVLQPSDQIKNGLDENKNNKLQEYRPENVAGGECDQHEEANTNTILELSEGTTPRHKTNECQSNCHLEENQLELSKTPTPSENSLPTTPFSTGKSRSRKNPVPKKHLTPPGPTENQPEQSIENGEIQMPPAKVYKKRGRKSKAELLALQLEQGLPVTPEPAKTLLEDHNSANDVAPIERPKRRAAKAALQYLRTLAEELGVDSQPTGVVPEVSKSIISTSNIESETPLKRKRAIKKHREDDVTDDADFVLPDAVSNSEKEEEDTDEEYDFQDSDSGPEERCNKLKGSITKPKLKGTAANGLPNNVMGPVWNCFNMTKELEAVKYLPKEKLSPPFMVKREGLDDDTSIHRINRFQSVSPHHERWDFAFFVGGPVWSMEWCPTPDGSSASQFVAIYCNNGMDDRHKHCALHSEPALLQIWKLGNLCHDSCPSSKAIFSYGIALDYGCIWDMKWCPSGAWETFETYRKVPRLGLLAAAFSNGQIAVFSLPYPESLANYKKSHYKGTVALWSLTTKSALLKIRTSGGSITIFPYHSFLAHDHAVRFLTWCKASSDFIITASEDRKLKFWDLRRTYEPAVAVKRNLSTEVSWLLHWCGISVAQENCFAAYGLSGIHYVDAGYLGFKPYFVAPRRGTVWPVYKADLIEYGRSDKDPLNVEAETNSETNSAVPLCQPQLYSEAIEKYYVLFDDTDMLLTDGLIWAGTRDDDGCNSASHGDRAAGYGRIYVRLCGGSASGKTTVANKIIEALDVPWVVLLSMDSFYKVLSKEEQELAAKNEYNFDHPDAFDFELLITVLRKLKKGKSVKVPVYDFTLHSRRKEWKTVYGANVVIFEGILAFANKELLKLLDMKVFVDTDSDIRLVRRLKRDITERGRDISGVIKQYNKFVKPAFEQYIEPTVQVADIVVPRGGENFVALDLIVQHVHSQLEKDSDLSDSEFDASDLEMDIENKNEVPALSDQSPSDRGTEHFCVADKRAALASAHQGQPLPTMLSVMESTPQVRGMHTIIRNKDTNRDEFIFYSKRLMRLLIEHALSFLPLKITGVSILRAGETMEQALMAVCKDIRLGKILIQTNHDTGEPEDHDVQEDKIFLLSLLMAEMGVHSVAYAFPKVRIITTAVDKKVNDEFHIIPGIGNFGDRYFGTDAPSDWYESDESMDY